MGNPKTEIPEQYKPKASGPLNLRASFSASGGSDEGFQQEVKAQQQKQKTEQIRDWNHTTAQSEEEGTTLRSGRIKLSHVSAEDNRAAEKKKERERGNYRFALKQAIEALEARLAEIDREMSKIDNRIDEIDEELVEIDELEDLVESGKIDPNNKEHKKLMEKYNIDQAAIDNGTWLILLQQQREYRGFEKHDLEKRHDELKRERNGIEEKINELRNDTALSAQEKYEKIGRLRAENIDHRNQIKAIESTGAVSEQNEYAREVNESKTALSVEAEIENFMKEYARAQGIENPVERKIREKDLVTSLSPESADNLSFEDTTAHLFEENYFKDSDTTSLNVHVSKLSTAEPSLG